MQQRGSQRLCRISAFAVRKTRTRTVMRRRKAVVGIDPGQKGGIAIIPLLGPKGHTEAHPMPLRGDKSIDWERVADLLRPWSGIVYIEKVHSMPKQGVASTFKFGTNYGGLFGACGAFKLPVRLVTPQAWKKKVLASYEERDKAAAIDKAAKTFKTVNLVPPGCRKESDGIADALCIALFGLDETLDL